MVPTKTLQIRNSDLQRQRALQPPACRRSRASRRFPIARCRVKQALTLLEMLLVLAVLVAIAAIALPAMQGPMDDVRLQKAGDIVRAEWAKARVLAMRTGQLQVFRFQVGTSYYSVQPWSGGDTNEIAADVPEPTTTLTDPNNVRLSPLGQSGVNLPDGIVFHQGDTLADARLTSIDDGTIGEGGQSGQAPPIVFYPDGSSSDAQVLLTNNRFYVRLTLRGLTGLSKGSPLLTDEELLQ